MRVTALSLVVVAIIACKQEPQKVPALPAEPVRASSQEAIRGRITEKMDVSQYSYLKLKTDGAEVWTAVPRTSRQVGETAEVLGPVWMEKFSSKTLNRTWDRIAFGTLAGETPPAAPAAPPQAAQSVAQRGAGPGMFAAQATTPVHGTRTGETDVGEIKVAKAGKTVAEIYSAKNGLKNKQVSVRGKVVKATNGVLGKNWLHLRDGTGKGDTADLAVSSDGTAAVGDMVLVTGVVHLDRDLGAGYHYDVIVEDAKIRVE
jgi:hypothetical protein